MGHSYRDLVAWQKAKALAVRVYRATENFPKAETYGLRSQMRRAAVSVASNIAEGQGRRTPGEFGQFLGHARGSLLELETQADIAHELALLSSNEFTELQKLSGEVLGLVNGLCDYTERLQATAHAGMSAT